MDWIDIFPALYHHHSKGIFLEDEAQLYLRGRTQHFLYDSTSRCLYLSCQTLEGRKCSFGPRKDPQILY
jgi:hypothetical protein